MPTEPTTSAPLRRDARANRDRILEAARVSFATGGIDVSVEEIAQRAGVGMGTLYRRFPTKEDLIDAVLEDVVRRVRAPPPSTASTRTTRGPASAASSSA